MNAISMSTVPTSCFYLVSHSCHWSQSKCGIYFLLSLRPLFGFGCVFAFLRSLRACAAANIPFISNGKRNIDSIVRPPVARSAAFSPTPFFPCHTRACTHPHQLSQSVSQPLTRQAPMALKHETQSRLDDDDDDDDDDRDLLYLRPNCLAL